MKTLLLAILLTILSLCEASARAQSPQATPQTQATPEVSTWQDDFTSDKLDANKWEKFTFEGGAGGKLEVKDGTLRLRSASKTRAGVRSVPSFTGERWIVEAQVAKVGPSLPEPGTTGIAPGYATLTIMFDGSGRNRIEWILTSEGVFEAWAVRDGQGERLDNHRLGTKIKSPVLSIVRRGDEFLFVLNDPQGKPEDAQVGLRTTVKNMPKSFRVMLYGYGSSENNWDNVRVVTAK